MGCMKRLGPAVHRFFAGDASTAEPSRDELCHRVALQASCSAAHCKSGVNRRCRHARRLYPTTVSSIPSDFATKREHSASCCQHRGMPSFWSRVAIRCLTAAYSSDHIGRALPRPVGVLHVQVRVVRTQRETCFHLCLEIGDKVCGDGERRESAGGMRLRTRRYGRYGHRFLAGMNPAWYASRNWGRDLIETTHPCSRYFDHHHWGSPTYNVRPCTRCYWADH
jgi:hypothetical protein